MSVSNGQLANAATFNGAFVSKTANSTTSGTLTQDKESILKEIATPTTPASGYGKIYFKSDGKLYQLNDAGIETQVGTGTGGGAGGINYIINGAAEDNNTTGWGTYADAAGASPVDGSGGTANVTISTSASSPLIGTYSFLMVKDAVNRQGEGWEYDFTIDSAYKAKVLQIDFEYLVSSGTFAAGTSSTDSDVTVWIYDVTNAVVIQPSAYKLLSNSSTLSTKHSATFQSAANSTSYRLIFHVGSTSASAYTLKVDGISVSPEQYVYGTPVTDWQAYTPTLTGFGTATNVQFQWRRVGDNVEVRGKFTSGTSTATEARATLPSVTSADTGKIPSIQLVGMAANSAAAANSRTVLIEPSVGYVTFGITTSGPLTKANASAVASSGETVSFFGLVPVLGFSSSVQTSDQTDTRIVDFAGTQVSQAVTANVTNISFTTVKDTHGAWSTNQYTVQAAGDYLVSASFLASVAGTAGDVYKNGSRVGAYLGASAYTNGAATGGSALVTGLVTGDIITVRSTQSATLTAGYLSIHRLSGPSAIAASETVSMTVGSSTTSIASGTPTKAIFSSVSFDSHSAYNTTTGTFTVPVSGKYSVSAFLYWNNASTGNAFRTLIYKNGSKAIDGSWGVRVGTEVSSISAITLRCNAGDTIEVYGLQADGAARALSGSATEQVFSVNRIGN